MSSSAIDPPASVNAPSRATSSNPETETGGGILHVVANIAGAVLILGLGVSGLLFFGRKAIVAVDTTKQAAAVVAPFVETTAVQAWDRPFHLEIDGEAATYRILTVGAEVSGRVLTKSESTRSGTFVNKGDVLFEIDAVNYRLEEQRLQARVNQAQEELSAVEVDLQNTTSMLRLAEEENGLQRNHLERIRSLFDRKATTESDMDTATREELASRNAMQTQQNQLNAFAQLKKTKEAALKLAQAEFERTHIDLQRCQIVSPITGRIVDDMKEEGDYVKPGDTLVHVSDSSRMEIKCSLKGEELAWIWQHGQALDPQLIATSESAAVVPTEGRIKDPFRMPKIACEIAFEFEGVETVWDGYLSRYEGTGMDRATRMFPSRVIVEQPEKTRITAGISSRAAVSPPTLLTGMYVTVRIPIDSPVPLLAVPAESLRPGEQLWIVRDGYLRVVSVSLVRVDGTSALVHQKLAPLHAGDQVIVSPLASVSEGMPVTVQAAAVQSLRVGEVHP